jgi:hypothetical protein
LYTSCYPWFRRTAWCQFLLLSNHYHRFDNNPITPYITIYLDFPKTQRLLCFTMHKTNGDFLSEHPFQHSQHSHFIVAFSRTGARRSSPITPTIN